MLGSGERWGRREDREAESGAVARSDRAARDQRRLGSLKKTTAAPAEKSGPPEYTRVGRVGHGTDFRKFLWK